MQRKQTPGSPGDSLTRKLDTSPQKHWADRNLACLVRQSLYFSQYIYNADSRSNIKESFWSPQQCARIGNCWRKGWLDICSETSLSQQIQKIWVNKSQWLLTFYLTQLIINCINADINIKRSKCLAQGQPWIKYP